MSRSVFIMKLTPCCSCRLLENKIICQIFPSLPSTPFIITFNLYLSPPPPLPETIFSCALESLKCIYNSDVKICKVYILAVLDLSKGSMKPGFKSKSDFRRILMLCAREKYEKWERVNAIKSLGFFLLNLADFLKLKCYISFNGSVRKKMNEHFIIILYNIHV